MPSYGSTSHFYQVKKVLNSGACSKDGRIHVGDRLVAIEGHDLRGVSHLQCISLLQEHSVKEQVTLRLLRQSKQRDDDPDITEGDAGQLTSDPAQPRPSSPPSDTRGNPANGRSSIEGAYDDDSDDVLLSNIEIDRAHTAKHSPVVHHNQIFARQHVKLAYARNSFRVKKDRQIPKIPKDEDFNRGEEDTNNSNKSSSQSNASTSNSSDVSANSSDTEHEKATGPKNRKTVENLNEVETLNSGKQVESETSEDKEINEEESIGTENVEQLISQDQKSHTREMDVVKQLEGSSQIQNSDSYFSSESGYIGDRTLSTIHSETPTSEVTITRVNNMDIPRGYQRYEMSRSSEDFSMNNNNKLNVSDSDSELESTADLLRAAPDKVQELLATTPPGGNDFLPVTPPGEAPPPPPEFTTDDESLSEAPSLPSVGPPSMPPPAVPRSISPASDTIETFEDDMKEQTNEEVSQTLSNKMKFLDEILNDDTLPVTNIDDLLDDDEDSMGDCVDGLENSEDRRQDPFSSPKVRSQSPNESVIKTPKTAAELEHALVNPFEQLERDLDRSGAGGDLGATDPSCYGGSGVTVVEEEEGVRSLGQGLHGARGSDLAAGDGAAAAGGSDGSGEGTECEVVEGLERVSHRDLVDTSVAMDVSLETAVDSSEEPAAMENQGPEGPPVFGDPHVTVYNSTAPLEQAQLPTPNLHVGSHYDQQKKVGPSSSQHDTFVFSSNPESGSQFTQLEHNFGTDIDSSSENVTVVRITSVSKSLIQPATPTEIVNSTHEQLTHQQDDEECGSDSESADQPPPLPTTDVPHPPSAVKSDDSLIDEFIGDSDNQLDSVSVNVVGFHGDQDVASTLDGDLSSGLVDLHGSCDRLSTITADTLLTNVSLNAPNLEDISSESNSAATLDQTYNGATSDIDTNNQTETRQNNHKEHVTTNLNTTLDADGTEEQTLDNTSENNESSAQENNHPSDSQVLVNFDQTSDDDNRNINGQNQMPDLVNIQGKGKTDDNSNLVQVSHSGTPNQHGFNDDNCLVDLGGQNNNSLTEEITTCSSAVESTIELHDSNTGNHEVEVEITTNKYLTDNSNGVDEIVEEVTFNPTTMYNHRNTPAAQSATMKTTGDCVSVNAHGNGIDVITSENNFATANNNRSGGNQTVTDSTLTHETLAKTDSECGGADDTRGNRLSSSMNDVQFDISSSTGFSGAAHIKRDSDPSKEDSATDKKEESLPSTNHLSHFSQTSAVPPTSPLSPGSLSNVSESTKKDVKSLNSLPSLNLPKISSFESRKLTPVSPRSLNMKSSLTASSLKASSLPKIRNKRSEVEPFTVEVLKGLLGLGIKLQLIRGGPPQVVDIQKTGPIGRSSLVRSGDSVVSLNGKDLSGATQRELDQLISSVPRGLVRLVVTAAPSGGDNQNKQQADQKSDDIQVKQGGARKPQLLEGGRQASEPGASPPSNKDFLPANPPGSGASPLRTGSGVNLPENQADTQTKRSNQRGNLEIEIPSDRISAGGPVRSLVRSPVGGQADTREACTNILEARLPPDGHEHPETYVNGERLSPKRLQISPGSHKQSQQQNTGAERAVQDTSSIQISTSEKYELEKPGTSTFYPAAQNTLLDLDSEMAVDKEVIPDLPSEAPPELPSGPPPPVPDVEIERNNMDFNLSPTSVKTFNVNEKHSQNGALLDLDFTAADSGFSAKEASLLQPNGGDNQYSNGHVRSYVEGIVTTAVTVAKQSSVTDSTVAKPAMPSLLIEDDSQFSRYSADSCDAPDMRRDNVVSPVNDFSDMSSSASSLPTVKSLLLTSPRSYSGSRAGSRRSSIGSDAGSIASDFGSTMRGAAPPLKATRRESVIETLEKKRRESIGPKLKGLQVPSRRASTGTATHQGPVKALPTIAGLPAIGEKKGFGIKPFKSVQPFALKKHESFSDSKPESNTTEVTLRTTTLKIQDPKQRWSYHGSDSVFDSPTVDTSTRYGNEAPLNSKPSSELRSSNAPQVQSVKKEPESSPSFQISVATPGNVPESENPMSPKSPPPTAPKPATRKPITVEISSSKNVDVKENGSLLSPKSPPPTAPKPKPRERHNKVSTVQQSTSETTTTTAKPSVPPKPLPKPKPKSSASSEGSLKSPLSPTSPRSVIEEDILPVKAPRIRPSVPDLQQSSVSDSAQQSSNRWRAPTQKEEPTKSPAELSDLLGKNLISPRDKTNPRSPYSPIAEPQVHAVVSSRTVKTDTTVTFFSTSPKQFSQLETLPSEPQVIKAEERKTMSPRPASLSPRPAKVTEVHETFKVKAEPVQFEFPSKTDVEKSREDTTSQGHVSSIVLNVNSPTSPTTRGPIPFHRIRTSSNNTDTDKPESLGSPVSGDGQFSPISLTLNVTSMRQGPKPFGSSGPMSPTQDISITGAKLLTTEDETKNTDTPLLISIEDDNLSDAPPLPGGPPPSLPNCAPPPVPTEIHVLDDDIGQLSPAESGIKMDGSASDSATLESQSIDSLEDGLDYISSVPSSSNHSKTESEISMTPSIDLTRPDSPASSTATLIQLNGDDTHKAKPVLGTTALKGSDLEETSEGRASILSSPDGQVLSPSPTPSDADSGIGSNRSYINKSDKESLSPRRIESTATKAAAPVTKATGGQLEVELHKGAVGLGFCIEGGKGSPLGDRPISVKRLFKGSAAAQNVLQPGDEIVQANGENFTGLTHYSAWNYLKSLPEGKIKLVIQRKS